MNPIWLASYPRSGNTLVRTILFHCFNLKTGSVYSNDLGGNIGLENYVGHIEQNEDRSIDFPKGGLPIIKTHAYHKGCNSAIYVIRDGRAAAVSLWEFTNPKVSMTNIIEGRHKFGKWCDHLQSWDPISRPNTLLLKYEDILSDLDIVLLQLSDFLDREIINHHLPSRDTIAGSDGKWVRKITNWQSVISKKDLERFNEINKPLLEKFGYI
tara:strand:- start:1761 stop:2393 length:633 start_codon:yes stop_codon:yes gene_type:complete